MNKIFSTLLLGTLFFSFHVVAYCSELEELLTGFEEPTATKSENDLENLVDGFDESPQHLPTQQAAVKILPTWLDIDGSFNLLMNYNFAHDAPMINKADYRGLSMLKGRAEIMGNISFSQYRARIGVKGFYDAAYEIQGHSQYSEDLLDEYEKELELSEAWISTSLTEALDLKTGRQIVAWGRSDNIRIVDVINPLDLRTPGMTDIRDLRIPAALTKLDYYFDRWNLSTVIIHEARFNKTPVYNSEFYPGTSRLPEEIEPSINLENQQYGVALTGVFGGWDLSFYGASVFDSRAHLVKENDNQLVRKHERVKMFGLSSNIAYGNWLFKSEAAYWDELKFSQIRERSFSRIDYMFGVEYAGFSETVIIFECANRDILDFDTRLENPPDEQIDNLTQLVLRMNRDFSHDTVHLTLLLSLLGLEGEDGAFERMQLEYDVNDDISLKTGLVFYQSGNYQPYKKISDSDRIFLEFEYRF